MSNYTGPIKNIIVVMLENRSYDNVLGWLYNPGNAPPYNQAPPDQLGLNGLTGTETNPDPNSPGETMPVANQTTPTRDPGTGASYPPTAIPIFDPGEPFEDMAQQFLGLPSVPITNPYAASSPFYPPDTAHAAQGYTTNYAAQGAVPAANVADVMNYFTPAQLPVTAWLANNFAVCDRWFASVPTQTFTNRAFAHCAAPAVTGSGGKRYSLIDDVQYFVDGLEDVPSVFSALDAVYPDSAGSSPPNWKVYFHDYAISTLVVPYVRAKAAGSENVNVATYDNSDWGTETPLSLNVKLGAVPPNFMDDLENGNLPMYSFIEPRYSYNWAYYSNPSNSNHPGGSSWLSNKVGAKSPPTDAANGEAFLAQLYNALRGSGYWDKTLLIVTYDEHGGIFDHVVPPVAAPPGGPIPAAGDLIDPASDGFNFNVFGGRVPTIIISPYVLKGSTISPNGSTPFDHSSIVNTVWACFNLANSSQSSLTGRDAASPCLMDSLQSEVCNDAGPYSGPIPESSVQITPATQDSVACVGDISTEEMASAWRERSARPQRKTAHEQEE